jgi:lateral signaling target protein 2
VCIAGVADQLQTNFAADLRQILRAVFLINCSQEEEEKPAIIDEAKTKDNQQDLFEFRASEENVIRQSNSNQGSIGSQQSICSAEEVNVESDGSEGAVFEEEDEEVETHDDNELDQSRTSRYGNRLSGRSISLSDDATSSTADHHYSISTSPSTSHPQSPPKWLPDHVVPKCMSCESQFTAFRRRHHCRNCGKFPCSFSEISFY